MFQEKLDRVIEGLDWVFAVLDDILVIGEVETLAEAERVQDTRLLELMQRSRERSFGSIQTSYVLRRRMYHVFATSSLEMVEGSTKTR